MDAILVEVTNVSKIHQSEYERRMVRTQNKINIHAINKSYMAKHQRSTLMCFGNAK